jgi:hypothetical protein
LAFLALWSPGAARASDAGHKEWLIPGSADTIHEFSGIAIGMPCDEAIAKANQISQNGPLGQSFLRGELRTTLDGLKVDVSWMIYEVHLNSPKSQLQDRIVFSCAEDGAGRPVFDLLREMALGGEGTNPPAIASVDQIFEEKFGVPTVEYDPYNLEILFNNKGPITTKVNGCGEYYGGQFGDAILEFHPDKCTYSLVFTATPNRERPGTATWLKIHIFDHLRLENATRTLEKHKLETTPVAAPKL